MFSRPSHTSSDTHSFGVDDSSLLELKYRAIAAKGSAYCMSLICFILLAIIDYLTSFAPLLDLHENC